MRTIIFINEKAGNRNGRKKWKQIEEKFKLLFTSDFDIVYYSPPFSFFKDSLTTKYDNVIIGGGDGSVHFFINELMEQPESIRKNISIGAIGLGSSNDLHKPFRRSIGKIPIKIGPQTSIHDIGKVSISFKNETFRKYFLINASLGITAFGNHLFNNPDGFLRLIKSKFTGLAINYTAFKSILSYKNEPFQINSNELNKMMTISSINIIKNPHITGGLHFDQEIRRDDGLLGFHICENMTKLELIKTFSDLSKGKFSGKPKRYSSFEKEILITSDNKTPVELDGEIYYGNSFKFEVLNKQIELMQ